MQYVATVPPCIVCRCREELGSNTVLIALAVGTGAAGLPRSLLPATFSPLQPLLAAYEPESSLRWTWLSFSIALNQESQPLLSRSGMTTAMLSRVE